MICRPKVDGHGNGRRIAFAAQDARAFFNAPAFPNWGAGAVVKNQLSVLMAESKAIVEASKLCCLIKLQASVAP